MSSSLVSGSQIRCVQEIHAGMQGKALRTRISVHPGPEAEVKAVVHRACSRAAQVHSSSSSSCRGRLCPTGYQMQCEGEEDKRSGPVAPKDRSEKALWRCCCTMPSMQKPQRLWWRCSCAHGGGMKDLWEEHGRGYSSQRVRNLHF